MYVYSIIFFMFFFSSDEEQKFMYKGGFGLLEKGAKAYVGRKVFFVIDEKKSNTIFFS